jgi:hypothetical protein
MSIIGSSGLDRLAPQIPAYLRGAGVSAEDLRWAAVVRIQPTAALMRLTARLPAASPSAPTATADLEDGLSAALGESDAR